MQHFVVAERLFDAFEHEHIATTGAPLLKAEGRVATRAARQLHHLLFPLLNQPQLVLGLTGFARLGAEAIHKLLVMGDLAFAAGNFLFSPCALGLLGLQEGRVVAPIELDGLVVNVEDAGADVIEETVIVRDDHHRPGKIAQEGLQPADREDVEVVGRLVEQQRIRGTRQHLSEQDPQFEAAGKR